MLHRLLTWIFEPGFFSSQPVHTAVLVGGSVALVSAVVGVFTVMRGQSFGGHALTDVSTAGGSGASLVGADPAFGFVGLGVAGAAIMDLIGVQRLRGRDLATGVVLGASIGLAALFLYFDTTTSATTGATQRILFGSIFSTTATTLPMVAGFGAAALAIMGLVYRPLLLSSVSSDIAAVRGVRVRMVGLLFMVALAIAVGLSAIAIGSILSTALLIGPAAAAMRVTRQLRWTLLGACLIAVLGTWLGVLLAYDSAYWNSSRQGLPVSFLIVSVLFLSYVGSGLVARRTRRS
jgi:zinc/manganese transport system permease protein